MTAGTGADVPNAGLSRKAKEPVMSKMNRAQIHADHGHWQSHIQMWHEDLET